jgi:PAS domain S-box-containing protein
MAMNTMEIAEKEQEPAYQIEHAGDAIVNVDLGGRFTLVNRMAELISGYERQDLLGQHFTTLVHPGYWDLMSGLLRGGERDGRYHDIHEIEIVTKEAELVPLGVRLSVLKHQGRIVGGQIIARDIRERKRLERMKSEFLASVSHELRTPLASIMGFVELLLGEEPGELTPTQREFLEIMLESSHRLLGMVNDILDVSRIEAGDLDLRTQRIRLEEVVARAVRSARHLAESKEIALELEMGPPLPIIKGDPERLEQVMDNLLNNAVKFTPRGGQITVRVQSRQPYEVQVEVTDTGIGIPSADMAHLFSRFHRGENVAGQAIPGAGLGLHITQAIVTEHGGRIEVESEVGKGSTFRFTLPLKRLFSDQLRGAKLIGENPRTRNR